MPSPFPGMDPYLELASGWPNVHHRLVVGLGDLVQEAVRPRYLVSVEERVYLAPRGELLGSPDVVAHRLNRGGTVPITTVGAVAEPMGIPLPPIESIQEPYLVVRGPLPEQEVIVVMEVLSPSNKRSGRGQEEYVRKRETVLFSNSHLIEIDLLREGKHPASEWLPPGYDYSILVSRVRRRPLADYYPWTVRDPIRAFRLPLANGEEPVPIDLGVVVQQVYERGAFDLRVDYTRPPEPPLSPEDEAWADVLLRERGLR